MKTRIRTAALAFALVVANPGFAATEGGVGFDERIETSAGAIELHRAATMRYLLFEVYVAGLYLAPGVPPTELASTELPHRLEIEYKMDFSADDFRKSTISGIERNVDDSAFERLGPAIASMNALYEDIAEGDRYAVTYIPGKGTTLAKNGRLLGTVPGAEFARAYFAIWFGRDPFDEDLKRALLEPR